MAAPSFKTPRTCSQCGNNGHNARTCTEHSAAKSTSAAAAAAAGFMLFGVRVTAEGSLNSQYSSSSSGFRKCMSMNNLSQYEQQQEQQPLDSSGNAADVEASGYASDDAVHASAGRIRERKRGVPWTEEEHKLFLIGLKKVGKGDWRGISRNFVKTRTPTQVASHAQKYFLRRTNINRRRRRSSLFDITTDAVSNSSIEDQSPNQDSSTVQTKLQAASNNQTISTPKPILPAIISNKQSRLAPLIPIPPSSNMANLNLNQSPSTSSTTSTSTHGSRDRESGPHFLSLRLSSEHTSGDQESVSKASSFRGFNSNGDNIISVA